MDSTRNKQSNNISTSDSKADSPGILQSFTLAHLSDPHHSCMADIKARQLFNKRLYGYLRWKLHRGAEHQDKVLEAMNNDLIKTRPDHIAITGDLTHLSLPLEFQKAEAWLRSLGSAKQVTVIPGNHDAYVKTNWYQTAARWSAYMRPDDTKFAENSSPNFSSIFPSLRIRAHIALIGVCTAYPTAPYLAVGSVGIAQMEKLKAILYWAGKQRLFRVLLIHHPPAPGTVSWRKRLTDAPALRSLLATYGVELILHGHAHRAAQNHVKIPTGNALVMGAPSASAVGRTLQRRARYYIYYISPNAKGWDVKLLVRIYSPPAKRFTTEHEEFFTMQR